MNADNLKIFLLNDIRYRNNVDLFQQNLVKGLDKMSHEMHATVTVIAD